MSFAISTETLQSLVDAIFSALSTALSNLASYMPIIIPIGVIGLIIYFFRDTIFGFIRDLLPW